MTKTVEFYFTVLSSYAYLASPRVAELRDRTGMNLVFKPVDIMDVFEAVGTLPPAKQPEVRRRYRAMDLTRIARAHNMPINLQPAFWPVPQDLASGMIIAAQKDGHDPMALTQAILKAVWAQHRNIADDETLIELANGCGLHGADLLAQAKSAPIKAAFRANTMAAINKGVFGSPSFVVDGELFWGQDRLSYLEAVL